MGLRRIESPIGPSAAAAALQRELRRRLQLHLYDESGVTPAGTAIYSLADPREARISRYIGQTRQPARRLMQHLCTARLWLPDDTPWWVKAPRRSGIRGRTGRFAPRPRATSLSSLAARAGTTGHREDRPRAALGYLVRGVARWRWQHAVSPTRELRYSITFRTRNAQMRGH